LRRISCLLGLALPCLKVMVFFALLALATLHKANLDLVTTADIDGCWNVVAQRLTVGSG